MQTGGLDYIAQQPVESLRDIKQKARSLITPQKTIVWLYL